MLMITLKTFTASSNFAAGRNVSAASNYTVGNTFTAGRLVLLVENICPLI